MGKSLLGSSPLGGAILNLLSSGQVPSSTPSFVKRSGSLFGHTTSGRDQFDICPESVKDILILACTPNSDDQTNLKDPEEPSPEV
jgi:hypothetical protein